MMNALKRFSMMMLLVSSMFTVSNCDLLGDLADQAGDIIGDITSGGGNNNNGGSSYTCQNGTCEYDKGENAMNCSQDCSPNTNLSCGDNICSTQIGENPTICPQDCQGSVTNGFCGDNICDVAAGEPNWCNGANGNANDCGSVGYCGDANCQAYLGENQSSCSADCGSAVSCGDGICALDGSENGWCTTDCVNAGYCGDGVCQVANGENSGWCSSDCGIYTGYCGDGTCDANGSENGWCTSDCISAGYCGDNICDTATGENSWCTSDCTTNGYCGDLVCQDFMGENAGWCSDCTTAAVCGDGTCAADGSENGWCYDQYNNVTAMYDICGGYCGDGICQPAESSASCSADCGIQAGYCGDLSCDPNGNEDGWCYDGVGGTLCAVVGICGDGVCAINGSEDGWCYDSYNASTTMYDVCGGVANACGDGICAADGSEDGWCWDQNLGTEICGSTGVYAPTLGSITMSEASGIVTVDVTANSPDANGFGVYYIAVDLYDTNGSWYGYGTTIDYNYFQSLTSNFSISHSATSGTSIYPYIYMCDYSDCTWYSYNSAISTTNYSMYNIDTANTDVDSGIAIPFVTIP